MNFFGKFFAWADVLASLYVAYSVYTDPVNYKGIAAFFIATNAFYSLFCLVMEKIKPKN